MTTETVVSGICSKAMSKITDEGYTFTKEGTKKLISFYEQYPELHNPQSKEYKNKYLRQESFNRITTQFNEYLGNPHPNIKAADVRKKISNLRTQFMKERNKIKKSMVSGAGRNDIYNPTWYFYEDLLFLAENNPMTETESNLNMITDNSDVLERVSEPPDFVFEGTIEEFNESELLSQVEAEMEVENEEALSPIEDTKTEVSTPKHSLPLPYSAVMKKKKTHHELTADVLKQAVSVLNTCNTNTVEGDHFETFGATVAAELRRIKSKKRAIAVKRTIMNLIYEELEDEED